tara:strand:+ start:1190 stop:1531 length:342 start_codon:yes stop_codon:yes gene_type:complete
MRPRRAYGVHIEKGPIQISCTGINYTEEAGNYRDIIENQHWVSDCPIDAIKTIRALKFASFRYWSYKNASKYFSASRDHDIGKLVQLLQILKIHSNGRKRPKANELLLDISRF